MNRFAGCLRFVIVSPETVAVLAVAFLYRFTPEWLEAVGEKFVGDFSGTDTILALPIGLTYFSYERAKLILFPDETLRRELQHWDGYQGLHDRVVFALTVTVICSVASILLRTVGDELSDLWRGTLLLLSVVLSATPVPGLVFAEFKIKALCDKYSPDPK